MTYTSKEAFKRIEKLAAKELYSKLSSYTPDDKLNAVEIAQLMFILRYFNDELAAISFKKAAQK